MLKIRQAQLDVLHQRRYNTLIEGLSHKLREKHSRVFQYYTHPQLNTWVRNQIETLKKHGIQTKYAVEGILELLALFGENFERCQDARWAQKIIEHKRYDADTKYNFLLCKAEQILAE